MLNYEMGVNATTTALNSQGSAMREQLIYSESLEARLNRLNTAWYGLSSTAGDSIIYDSIVVLTEGLKNLTNAGDSVVGKVGALAPVLGTVATAAVFFSRSLQGLVVSKYLAVTAAVAQTGATGILGSTMGLASVAAGGLATALRVLLTTALPIGIAVAGIGFVIEKLTSAMSANIQEQEKFDTYINQNTEALTTNKEAVNGLLADYTRLSSARTSDKSWDSEKEQEYLRVQQQLGDFFPALIDQIDATGQAHLKTVDEIQKEIDVLEDLAKVQAELKLAETNDEFKKLVATLNGGRFDKLGNIIEGSLEDQIERLKKMIKHLEENGTGDGAVKRASQLKMELIQLEQEYSETSKAMQAQIFETVQAVNTLNDIEISSGVAKSINDFVTSLDTSNLDSTQIRVFAKELSTVQESFQKAVDSGDTVLYDKATSSLNDLAKEYKLLDGDLKNYSVTAEDFFKAINNGNTIMVDGEVVVDEYGNAVGVATDALNGYASAAESLAGANQQQIDDSTELIYLYQALSSQLAGYTEEELISLANKPIRTAEEQALVDTYQRSIDVLDSLLAVYPDLLTADQKSILSTQDKIKAIEQENKANDVLIRAYEASTFAKLTAEQKNTVASAKGSKARIEILKAEMRALDSAMQLAQKYNIDTAEKIMAKVNSGELSFQTAQPLLNQIGAYQSKASELDALSASLDASIGNIDKFVTSAESSSKASAKSEKATKKDTKAKAENNKEIEKSIYLADKYKQALEALNLEISKQEALRENLPTFSDEYINSIKTQIELENNKLKLQQNQTKEIEKQVKAGAVQQTGIVKQAEAVKILTKQLSGYGGTISSKYGNRTLNGKSEFHRGTDIASKKGTGIDSFAGGKIVSAGYAGKAGAEKLHSSYGNVVVVQSDDGTKRLYAHMEKVLVKVGDQIEAGARIGTVGSTGNSTGAHLHYEKTVNGKLVDSYNEVMQARKGISTSTGGTSAEIANVQQAIDGAQSSLISLQEEVLAQQNNIIKLEKELIDASRSRTERIRTEVDAQYSNNESKLSNLNIKSKEYNDILTEQTNLLQRKQTANQQELDYINSLIKDGNLTANTLVELKDRTLELTTEMNNLNQEIQGSSLRKYEVFDELRETPEKKIEALRASMELLDESSVEYGDTLNKIILLLNEIQDVNKKEILTLADDINSGNFTGEKLEELRDKYEALNVTVKDTNKEIRDTFYEASEIKFKADDKAIDESNKKVETLKWQMGLLDDEEITLKVSLYSEIKKGIEEGIVEIDDAIKNAFVERELAIAKGFSTTVYDDRIQALIDKRRSQNSELQSIYNQIESYVKSAEDAVQQAISSGKSAVESAESKAYSDASNAMNKAIKESEDRLTKFTRRIKALEDKLSLLQESQFSEKLTITNQQLEETRNKANQIIAEYERIASIPVYNEEQKSQVESQLQSLKDELASTNVQIIEYVKNLELTHFESLTYGANKASKEIDRLTGKLNKNLELLEGGLLSGTDLDFSIDSISGKTLDLSTLISNPLAEREAQIQIQDIRSSAYGAQISEAETQAQREIALAQEKYEELKKQAEEFQKVMADDQLKFEEDLKKLMDASAKDKEKIKKKEGDALNKTAQESAKTELDNLKGHYENIKSTMSILGIDIKNQYSSIWGDIVRELESNIAKAEKALGNMDLKVNTSTSISNSDKDINKLVQGVLNGTVNRKPIVKNPLTGEKINAYASGTNGASGGLSLLGEEGRELVIEPDGSAFLTNPSNELRNLKAGTQVISADETKKLLTNKKTPISAYADGTGSNLLDLFNQYLTLAKKPTDTSDSMYGFDLQSYNNAVINLEKVAIQALTQGSSELISLFKESFSDFDGIVNNFDEKLIKGYFNEDRLQKDTYLNSAEKFKNEETRYSTLLKDALASIDKLGENQANGIAVSEDDKLKITELFYLAKEYYGENLRDEFGNKITDTSNLNSIGNNRESSRKSIISTLGRPDSADNVLLYENGKPISWYAKDIAENLASVYPEIFSIGKESAKNYLSSNSGSSNGGLSSSSGTSSYNTGSKTPITYSKEFIEKYDPYGEKGTPQFEQLRNERAKEIEALQKLLDEELASESVNDDKVQQLTNSIIEKQQEKNSADSLFVVESLQDLSQQRQKIAQELKDTLTAELKTALENGSITEEGADRLREEIANQSEIINSAMLEQKNLVKQKLELEQANHDKQLVPFEEAIKNLQHELNMTEDDNSAEHLRINAEIAKQYEKQLDVLRLQKNELEALLSTQKVGSYEWNLTNQAIKDVNDKIQDTTEALKNSQKQLESNADKIIETMKRAIEKQRDLTIASFKKQLDALEKLYNDKMDAIGDRETERSYAKDLLEKEKEIAEIEKKLDILALDNSQAGIAKRLDLEELLADKKEDLAEFQYQKSVELEKKAVEDTHKQHKESIEQQIKDEEYKFNELLKDERHWAKVREEIVNGNLDSVNAKHMELLGLFKSYNESATKEMEMSFQELLNLIDELGKSYDSLNKKTDIDTVVPPVETNKPITKPESPTAKPNQGKPPYTVNNADGTITTSDGTTHSMSNFSSMYNSLGGSGEEGILEALRELDKLNGHIPKYKNGGLTSNTGLHWLDGTKAKPEIVLNSNDTQNLLSAIEVNKEFLANLPKINLPTLPKFDRPDFASSSSNYDLTVNIDNLNGTQADANNVASTIIKSLRRMGQ